jgi:CheY-like chemotaxis protein
MSSHVVHVEDRRRLRQILTIGFKAFEPTIKLQQFRTGDAALPYITANGHSVDLFILALHFPGALDGLTLARHIRELGIAASIVLTSGSEAPAPAVLGSLDCEFYSNPWQIIQLAPQLLNYPLPHRSTTGDSPAREGPGGGPREPSPQPTRSKRALRCPTCGQPRQPNQALCPHCGRIFLSADKLQTGPRSTAYGPGVRAWSKGPVTLDGQHDIVLQIRNEPLVLPQANELILGWPTALDEQGVVDLSPWGAKGLGVSRRHLRLVREHGLLHAIDLNSTNGTWIDGRRLVPNSQYVVRDGDYLSLANLRMRVSFQPSEDTRVSPQGGTIARPNAPTGSSS